MRLRRLLLTATLVPKGGVVTRSDPAVRLEDYKEALRFWLELCPPEIASITFVENSGADLAPLRALVPSDRSASVEFLSFCGREIPQGVNYGYGELEILEYAHAHSAFLEDENCLIIKATGRLKFPQITKLLSRLTDQAEFVVDGRSNLRRLSGRTPFVATQLMFYTRTFFDANLSGRLGWFSREHGRTHLENLVCEVALSSSQECAPGKVLCRFPVNAEPRGVGGAGAAYSFYGSPRSRLIALVRATMRIIAPKLWI